MWLIVASAPDVLRSSVELSEIFSSYLPGPSGNLLSGCEEKTSTFYRVDAHAHS